MAEEITCPVCRLEHISAEKNKCPQCDADLTCFKVLSSLPEEPIREKNIQGTGFPVWVFIILFIGFITVIITNQFLWFMQFKILLRDQQTSLTDSMRSIAKTLEDPAQNRQEGVVDKPEVLHEEKLPEKDPQEMYFWTYRVKDGDTLWSISKWYYGSGHYYPVLLEHNPYPGIYTIQKGSWIKILTDARRAKKEYARIIMSEGNRIYWDYTIKEGDTIESLAVKFYKTQKQANLIFDLNPGLRLKTGESVKILLK